ncbi:hypothetical protein C8D77_114117 [Mesorhizobium loti]|uniref:Uncharacterized protein n=1 Tax=Rhizobium loti TaxID=381 RepID=A0A8E3B2H8_RHILI|nr:hypothetical protein [Mesorhizobium loti]PWJ87826.1 hypothetical protein C8D77_114117 [Mesorhizobium loti]
MTTKFQILTTQDFTDVGNVGVGLFICGPIFSGLCYVWLLSEMSNSSYDQHVGLPWAMIFLGGIANLLGFPMMLVGRKYEHIAAPLAEQAKKTNEGW